MAAQQCSVGVAKPSEGRRPYIFVSVGSMLPFDRLVEAMDKWAADHPDQFVRIQIGNGQYVPKVAAHARVLSTEAYKSEVAASDVFVAHAGMGSIFAAFEASKPLLMLPRLRTLGEHNTDHQLATLKHFGNRTGLYSAMDVDELYQRLGELLDGSGATPEPISPFAPDAFIRNIRAEILKQHG
jgi:UDP-N-acetylglucosamine transferase subunit ALG13